MSFHENIVYKGLELPLNELYSNQLRNLSLPQKLTNANKARKTFFLAGRLCANLCLEEFGETTPIEIPIMPDGAPSFPHHYVGSITHTKNFVAAAVAKKSDYRSIGIDSQVMITPKSASRISKKVVFQTEIDKKNQSLSDEEFVTLVFSIKESIYKCLRPLCGNFFGFHDAEIISFDYHSNSFVYVLNKDIGNNFIKGFRGKGFFEITTSRVSSIVKY